MGKYASWAELERTVPQNYKDKATPKAFQDGMNGIAPSGMHVKAGRVDHYRDGVDGKGDLVVSQFKRAMFE
jgi:hypothetical protein